jgi:MFS family permease
MWLLYFINGFNQSITGNLAPFITSEFEAHSLVPLISVVSSIMGAATYMPLAKILNLWDRWVGFALMAGFATLGLILAASCNGIGVYCASQVFYSIGFTGMTFSIDVITADTSSLKDRGLAYAFTSSPYIITAYAGPAAAAKFYANNWRWAYGSFAIILPCFAVPMVGILNYAKRQAKAKGLLPPAPPKSGRTFAQSFKHYVIEFDGESSSSQHCFLHELQTDRNFQSSARSFSSPALSCFCSHSTSLEPSPTRGAMAVSSPCWFSV